MMKYAMLLWPHANARYQAEARRLALCELELMLQCLAPRATVRVDESASWPGLAIESPEALDARALRGIAQHSLMYQLFERREDASLMPVIGRGPALLGEDLPAILKYKGKTNETFLKLLINVALYSGAFWDAAGPLAYLDPVCGRATAPFIALNLGWNAVGADVDQGDLREAERFFKRYLEYHHYKHQTARESRTLPQGRSAPAVRFTVADTPERFKAGDCISLQLIHLDAARSDKALPAGRFHLIAGDLPYGVRHDATPGDAGRKSSNWLEALLAKALPQWRAALKTGGALALSFNAQGMKREHMRSLLNDAGFEVLSGGPYDSFEHWVEQAITRDVAVARKCR